MSRYLDNYLVGIGFFCIAMAAATPASAIDMEDVGGKALDKVERLKQKFMKGPYVGELQSKRMLKKIDENDNRSVTAAEYMNYMGIVFDTLDTDTDNVISDKEWVASKTGGKLGMMSEQLRKELTSRETMRTIDEDDDNDVTRDEFVDFHQAIYEDMAKDKGSARY